MTRTNDVPSPWLPFRSRTSSGVKLFCFPFAGGSAGAFGPMWRAAPDGLDVAPVELPGRFSRLGEPPFESVTALVDAAYAVLGPQLPARFSLLGYSFGALIAFEFARRCARDGITPEHLFVAASVAPQQRRASALHTLRGDELTHSVAALYGGLSPSAIADPELRDAAIQALIADLKALEKYRYVDDGRPLACPITALGGEEDGAVSRAGLLSWGALSTGPVALRMFPGGHFFFRSATTTFLDVIVDALHRPQACGA